MKLIVGQFNDSFQPVMDGVANVTKNYAYWLNKKHGKSYVITPSFPDYHDNEEFQVFRYFSVPVPTRPPYRFGIPQLDFSIKKNIIDIPFDIVHAHSPFSSGKLALNIARKRGIPIVATFHSKFYDDFKEVVKLDSVAKFAVKLVINFFNSVDYVWTVNESSVQTLRDYGFKGNITVVNNGTDFSSNDNIEKLKEKADNYLTTRSSELTFLFVGQHIWQKNLRMLIKSLHHLQEQGIEFKMIFVGSGYAEDEMKNLVKELQLDQSVKFLGLITDRELLKSIFCRANLFLFPSLYDTGGIVVQEAAAVGCPSLAIANSNVAEQIIDDYNGFLTEDDPKIFAAKIAESITTPDKLFQIGRNAQKTICKSWETIIDEVKDHYLEIIRLNTKTG